MKLLASDYDNTFYLNDLDIKKISNWLKNFERREISLYLQQVEVILILWKRKIDII